MTCNEFLEKYDLYWNSGPVAGRYSPEQQEWFGHQQTCPACQEWTRAEYCRNAGVNPAHHCCLWMAYYLARPIETTHQGRNRVIDWVSQWDEYFIPITYDGYRATRICFCPWCGRKLGESKRELWFQKLYALGYDDPAERDWHELPAEYHADKWWREGGA